MKEVTMINILKPDFIFSDDRGTLTQLIHNGYKQVNVITSKADTIRGGHYHKINTEAFFVVEGAFQLVAEYKSEKKEYSFKKGDMFCIPPFVSHDFIYTEDTILVSMYDKGVELENGEKDIYKK